MSEETYPKYIKVTSLQDANEKSHLYSLREPIVYTYQDDFSGQVKTDVEYLLSLREPSKYEDITNLIDVEPSQVDEYLAKGYTVTDSWSKFIRMVKKREQYPRLSVIREAIVNAFSVTENWDDKDTNLKNNILSYLEGALDEIEGEQIDDPSDTEF